MKKSVQFIMIIMLAISLLPVSVLGQTPSTAARAVGYHDSLYTQIIRPSNQGGVNTDFLSNIFVRDNLSLGSTSAGTPTFRITTSNDRDYYITTPSGKIIMSSPVDISSPLVVTGKITGTSIAVSTRDVIDSDGNWVGVPIPSSSISGDVVAASCPAGQVVTATTTAGVTCTVVDASIITDEFAGGTCAGATEYVKSATKSGVTCGLVTPAGTTPAATGACGANQFATGTTASGVTCSAITTSAGVAAAAIGNCPAGQFVTTTTAGGVTCAAPAGAAWTISGNNVYTAVTGNVGIGTASPTAKLEVNGDIKMTGKVDFGSVSGCTGTPTSCSSFYSYGTCAAQSGCYSSCQGTVYCSSVSDQSSCENIGCSWDYWSNSCSGTSYASCSNYEYDASTCNSMGCYWSCEGNPPSCNTYPSSTCASNGCQWTTITNQISASGIVSSGYCDATGANCKTIKPTGSIAATANQGSDEFKQMRRNTAVSCPAGYYLSSVSVVSGLHAGDGKLTGTCTRLPIS